jgi:hypothetical protein
MRQHITEYNIVTENADSVGALPSINSPLDINLEDMRMISSDDHIYFSWLNSMGMDNAWLVFDKTTGCLITPATPLPKLYDCGAITTDNNNLYLSGTDATDTNTNTNTDTNSNPNPNTDTSIKQRDEAR